MNKIVRDGILITMGILAGLFLYEAHGAAKTFDERKWERLEKQRQIRRVIEARYEECAQQCLRNCK